MSLGTPLKTKSGDIDTGDRSGRYTGFAFMDLNGNGFKDIILSKGYNQDLVYYPGKPYGKISILYFRYIYKINNTIDTM